MVMAEKHKKVSNYTNGSLAYEMQPGYEIQPPKKKTKKQPSNKQKNQLAKKLKMIATVMTIAACALLTLTRYSMINSKVVNVRKIKSEVSNMQKTNEALAVDIAKGNNIKNIEQIATKNYGMVEADINDVTYVDVKTITRQSKDEASNKSKFSIRNILELFK